MITLVKSQMKPATVAWALIALFFLTGCASREEKKATHFKRAREYVEALEYNKAVIEFKNVIQLEPGNDAAYFELGETYLKLKQGGEAFRAFLQAVSLNPDNLKAQVRVGRFLLLSQKTREARERAELVLEKTPDDLEALFLLSEVQLQEKDLDAATKTLEKSARLYPNRFQAQLALARLEMLKKDLKKAETFYRNAISLAPSSSLPYIELSNLYASMGRSDLAEVQLKEMIRNSRPHYQNFLVLGRFYEREKKWPEAERAYLRAVDNAPGDDARSVVSLAAYYARRGSYDKAMETFSRALAIKRDDLNLLLAIAQLQFDFDHMQAAGDTLDKILTKDKSHPGANLLKGRLALINKDFAGALGFLDAAVTGDPKNDDAFYYRGLSYLGKNEPHLAQQDLLKALELNPKFVDARLILAKIYLAQRNLKLASQQMGALLKQAPQDVRVHMARGNLSILQKDSGGAEEAFKKVIELDPGYAPGYVRMGLVCSLTGRESDALRYFQKALELNPLQMDALALPVQFYVREKRYDKAFEVCEKHRPRLEHVPAQLAFLDYLEGYIFLAEKDFLKAEQYFKRAIHRNPSLLLPYVALAKVYALEQRFDQAIREYKSIVTRNPNYLAGYMALATIHDQKGEAEEAESYYRKALEIKKDFGPAYNNLAWNLAQRGQDIDSALMYARMAKEQMPTNASVMDTLGWIYYLKGSYQEAIVEFQESLLYNPDNALVHYHMGMACYKSGRLKDAEKFLEKALRIDESFGGAQEASRVLKELRDASKSAITG